MVRGASRGETRARAAGRGARAALALDGRTLSSAEFTLREKVVEISTTVRVVALLEKTRLLADRRGSADLAPMP